MLGGQAQLEKATIRDGRPRNVVWINDMLGQGVRRDERDNQTGGDPAFAKASAPKKRLGAVSKSMAAMASACSARKAVHAPPPGRPRRGSMYFETVDWAS